MGPLVLLRKVVLVRDGCSAGSSDDPERTALLAQQQ
jgi:hypothetical protein